ncbi:MAG: dihydropteroate synthase [Verrucomicrobiae bacterium]|nr:dihydropteroate synthase [Verrucomicrobiae bacterium]
MSENSEEFKVSSFRARLKKGVLKARNFEINYGNRAVVMGIVNVTPDSFFDGGRYFDKERAVERIYELVEHGADIIDIGGESTRPGAEEVSEGEELRRVIPVIEAVASKIRVPISIDTMKPVVAKAALEAGACIVNDVGANRDNALMWEVAAQSGAAYVIMHMKGTPRTMQMNPVYEDVVAEVDGFFRDRIGHVKAAGVREDSIVLDPGIGFGKTVEHNLLLLRNLSVYVKFGMPLLIGVSRKSFIGRVLNLDVKDRMIGSVACELFAWLNGAAIIRTHNVKETLQAIRMVESILYVTRSGL